VLFLALCAAQKTTEVKVSKSLCNLLPALRVTDGDAGRRKDCDLQFEPSEQAKINLRKQIDA
jgi:hypothetical protein